MHLVLRLEMMVDNVESPWHSVNRCSSRNLFENCIPLIVSLPDFSEYTSFGHHRITRIRDSLLHIVAVSYLSLFLGSVSLLPRFLMFSLRERGPIKVILTSPLPLH